MFDLETDALKILSFHGDDEIPLLHLKTCIKEQNETHPLAFE